MLRIILLSICISHTIHEMQAVTVKPNTNKKFEDTKISRIQPLPIEYHVEARDGHWNDNYHKQKLKFQQKYQQQQQQSQHQLMSYKKPEKYNKKLERGKGKSISNAQLLDKLGLSKLNVPLSHNRKRLAVESRHHGRPDDSHMFVIKLPPNPYYYGNNKPSGHEKNSIDDFSQKIPVGFKSNGKPGRIYHWNLPVIKKMFGTSNGRNPNSRHTDDDDADFFDIKNIPTWSKPSWENDSLLKPHKLSKEEEKNLKKKSPTYYAPKPHKNSVHKYFPGNGKPQSFYVIEKSHKPAYYQKLIA